MTGVAEGVETREELCVLREMGIELFQGYYFGRPVAIGDFPPSAHAG